MLILGAVNQKTHGSCLNFPLFPLEIFGFCDASESAWAAFVFFFRLFKVLLVNSSWPMSLRWSSFISLSLFPEASGSNSLKVMVGFDTSRAERRDMVALNKRGSLKLKDATENARSLCSRGLQFASSKSSRFQI